MDTAIAPTGPYIFPAMSIKKAAIMGRSGKYQKDTLAMDMANIANIIPPQISSVSKSLNRTPLFIRGEKNTFAT